MLSRLLASGSTDERASHHLDGGAAPARLLPVEWRDLRRGPRLRRLVAEDEQVDPRQGFKNSELSFGVNNLLDKDPPFSDDETQGYDFSTHNPVGRLYYGRVKYAF